VVILNPDEGDRAVRNARINDLTELQKVSGTDRAFQLGQAHELAGLLQAAEADRVGRPDQTMSLRTPWWQPKQTMPTASNRTRN
jgi:hypothetical protein